MATEFPLEILQHIFSHHSKDIRLLRICSLVCRNWLTGAQSLLFRTVTVSFNRTTIKRFNALIKDSPGLAHLVRKLVIEGWSNYALYSPEDVHIMARMLNRLPQVYHVVFSSFHFAYYGSFKLPPQLFTAISAFLSSLPYPAHISFQDCIFSDFAVVLQFLEARQQEMHKLTFSGCRKSTSGSMLSVFQTIPNYAGATKTILEALSIRDCAELGPEIAGFFVHSRVSDSLFLHHLQQLRCGRDAAAVLLPRISLRLRSFVLEIRDGDMFSPGSNSDYETIAPSLRSSQNLRSIRFVVISRWGSFYPWIFETISSISPHHTLEEIIIDSVIDQPDMAEHLVELEPLDRLISRTHSPPFPALDKIRLRLPKHGDSLLLQFYSISTITAIFPLLSHRGLLAVEERERVDCYNL